MVAMVAIFHYYSHGFCNFLGINSSVAINYFALVESFTSSVGLSQRLAGKPYWWVVLIIFIGLRLVMFLIPSQFNVITFRDLISEYLTLLIIEYAVGIFIVNSYRKKRYDFASKIDAINKPIQGNTQKEKEEKRLTSLVQSGQYFGSTVQPPKPTPKTIDTEMPEKPVLPQIYRIDTTKHSQVETPKKGLRSKKAKILIGILVFLIICAGFGSYLWGYYDDGLQNGMHTGYELGEKVASPNLTAQEAREDKAYQRGYEEGYAYGRTTGITEGKSEGEKLVKAASNFYQTAGHKLGYQEGYTAGSKEGYQKGFDESTKLFQPKEELVKILSYKLNRNSVQS